jgi:pimeloyl-ACP methyl ester carboxylesterase
LRTACGQLGADDPKLIIVGHSLGGVISYDILTHFDPTLEVDVFVTVGSQVALFEEMGLYKHALPPANAPADRLARPANIKRWMNVLDPNDAFSFRAEGVYAGVTDFKYDTGYGLMQAHSGYFHRPSFYRRLGERLAEFPP